MSTTSIISSIPSSSVPSQSVPQPLSAPIAAAQPHITNASNGNTNMHEQSHTTVQMYGSVRSNVSVLPYSYVSLSSSTSAPLTSLGPSAKDLHATITGPLANKHLTQHSYTAFKPTTSVQYSGFVPSSRPLIPSEAFPTTAAPVKLQAAPDAGDTDSAAATLAALASSSSLVSSESLTTMTTSANPASSMNSRGILSSNTSAAILTTAASGPASAPATTMTTYQQQINHPAGMTLNPGLPLAAPIMSRLSAQCPLCSNMFAYDSSSSNTDVMCPCCHHAIRLPPASQSHPGFTHAPPSTIAPNHYSQHPGMPVHAQYPPRAPLTTAEQQVYMPPPSSVVVPATYAPIPSGGYDPTGTGHVVGTPYNPNMYVPYPQPDAMHQGMYMSAAPPTLSPTSMPGNLNWHVNAAVPSRFHMPELFYYNLLAPFVADFEVPNSALSWLARATPLRSYKLSVPRAYRLPNSLAGVRGYSVAFKKCGLVLRDMDTATGHWHSWYAFPDRVHFQALQAALRKRWSEASNFEPRMLDEKITDTPSAPAEESASVSASRTSPSKDVKQPSTVATADGTQLQSAASSPASGHSLRTLTHPSDQKVQGGMSESMSASPMEPSSTPLPSLSCDSSSCSSASTMSTPSTSALAPAVSLTSDETMKVVVDLPSAVTRGLKRKTVNSVGTAEERPAKSLTPPSQKLKSALLNA